MADDGWQLTERN